METSKERRRGLLGEEERGCMLLNHHRVAVYRQHLHDPAPKASTLQKEKKNILGMRKTSNKSNHLFQYFKPTAAAPYNYY
jgi:hypothetical protein